MTKTTATVLLSALCFAPILTACDAPDEPEAEDSASHPRPVQVGEGMLLAAPEAEPVGIYDDDAPGPGGVEKYADLIIDKTSAFYVFPSGSYWNVQFRVKNIGTLKSPASKAAVLLLDDWNTPDPHGSHVGNVPELAPGAGAYLTIKIATTDDDIAGYEQIGAEVYAIWSYKTRFTADSSHIVEETNETNNIHTIAW